MKTKSLFLLFSIGVLGACNQQEKHITTVESFPVTLQLEAKNIELDSLVGVTGAVDIIGDNYLFYHFASEHFLAETDSNYKIQRVLFRKGQGPDEVVAITGNFGDITNTHNLAVFDPRRFKIIEIAGPQETDWVETDFGDAVKKYAPRWGVQLSSGKYAMLRGNEYGLILTDQNGNDIQEWPLGPDILNNNNVDYDLIAGRDLQYNALHKTVAESYMALPYVILHNEDGSIKHIISIGGQHNTNTKSESPEETIINSIRLTDRYVYVMTPDKKDSEKSQLKIISYDAEPVASLTIDQAYMFSVDTLRNRIIAINPNAESAIKEYSFSEKDLK